MKSFATPSTTAKSWQIYMPAKCTLKVQSIPVQVVHSLLLIYERLLQIEKRCHLFQLPNHAPNGAGATRSNALETTSGVRSVLLQIILYVHLASQCVIYDYESKHVQMGLKMKVAVPARVHE